MVLLLENKLVKVMVRSHMDIFYFDIIFISYFEI